MKSSATKENLTCPLIHRFGKTQYVFRKTLVPIHCALKTLKIIVSPTKFSAQDKLTQRPVQMELSKNVQPQEFANLKISPNVAIPMAKKRYNVQNIALMESNSVTVGEKMMMVATFLLNVQRAVFVLILQPKLNTHPDSPDYGFKWAANDSKIDNYLFHNG